MTPDKCDLPWTESGKELLKIVKREINKSGGRVKLRHLLIQENREWFNHKDIVDSNISMSKLLSMQNKRKDDPVHERIWTPEDIEYVVAKYGRIKTGKLAIWLNRTAPAVRNMFYRHASEETKLWVSNFGIDAHRFKNLKNTPKEKHEKETINNSQAQKDKAHRYRQEVGTSHHANL